MSAVQVKAGSFLKKKIIENSRQSSVSSLLSSYQKTAFRDFMSKERYNVVEIGTHRLDFRL